MSIRIDDRQIKNSALLLTQGGQLSYSADGMTLTITEDLKLEVNFLSPAVSPTVINLTNGTFVFTFSASGRMLYATVNRIAGTAVFTADAATVAAPGANQEIFLIAKRVDTGSLSRLYFSDGFVMNEGDSGMRLGSYSNGDSDQGEISADVSSGSKTVLSGKTLWWPHPTISSGDTFTISGIWLATQSLTVNGILTITGEVDVVDFHKPTFEPGQIVQIDKIVDSAGTGAPKFPFGLKTNTIESIDSGTINVNTSGTVTVPNATSVLAGLAIAQTFTETQTISVAGGFSAIFQKSNNAPVVKFDSGGTTDITIGLGGSSELELRSGNDGAAVVGTITQAGLWTIPNTTDSASISTGALTVGGGLGIGKSIQAGVAASNHKLAGNLKLVSDDSSLVGLTLPRYNSTGNKFSYLDCGNSSSILECGFVLRTATSTLSQQETITVAPSGAVTLGPSGVSNLTHTLRSGAGTTLRIDSVSAAASLVLNGAGASGIIDNLVDSLNFRSNGSTVGSYDQTGQWTLGPSAGTSVTHIFRSGAQTIVRIDSSAADSELSLNGNNGSIKTLAGNLIFRNTGGSTVGSFTQTGLWTLGASGGTQVHVINGDINLSHPSDNSTITFLGGGSGNSKLSISSGTLQFLNNGNGVIGSVTQSSQWTLGSGSAQTHQINGHVNVTESVKTRNRLVSVALDTTLSTSNNIATAFAVFLGAGPLGPTGPTSSSGIAGINHVGTGEYFISFTLPFSSLPAIVANAGDTNDNFVCIIHGNTGSNFTIKVFDDPGGLGALVDAPVVNFIATGLV